MENWACPTLAEDWDNVGLLIGDPSRQAEKILVALDASEATVNKAVQEGYDFIITHHPLIYNPLKRITADEPVGSKIIKLIKNNIGLYTAHTNLDIAEGGINDILSDRLCLTEKESLMESGLGKVGNLRNPMTLNSLVKHVKLTLSLPEVRFTGNPEQMIHKVGICAGGASRMHFCHAAIEKKCDVYITGDFHYHGITEAVERGLSLIDINHYFGEAPIIPVIASRLSDEAKIDKLSFIIEPFIEKNHLMQTIY
jgi:dinuclear metal center YbgI/SA1388 family protein